MVARGQGSWLKLRKRRDGSTAVPRANVLTNVAPKDMIAHGLAKFLRNPAAQFDGQVGNAPARVQNIRFDKRLRGTSIETLSAVSAQIRRGYFSFAKRWPQIQSGENDAKEEVRAERFVQQQRILAEPTQARVFGEHALLNWPCIHVGAGVERLWKAFSNQSDQL